MNHETVAIDDLDFQFELDCMAFKPKLEQLFYLGNLELLNNDLIGLVCCLVGILWVRSPKHRLS